jgi:hypothetical protein
MTIEEIDRWNRIADDIANRERVDSGMREIAANNANWHHRVSLVEVHLCPVVIGESDDVDIS